MKHVGIQGLTGLVLNPALVWISPETDPEVRTQGQEFIKEVLPGESSKGGRSWDTGEVSAGHIFR